MTTTKPQTLLEKIWSRHVAAPAEGEGFPDVLSVDLHLLHEVTSPQAFTELERRGLTVARSDRTLATMDHSTPTDGTPLPVLAHRDPAGFRQLEALAARCVEHGIPLFPLGHENQGIVHVIGPELGLTQPGMTIVCGDSHTSTHGAFGALAFGIGTSEVAQVLATQCLLRHRPRSFEVAIDGMLPYGVTAKDLALAVLAHVGVDGGVGHVFEYAGNAVRALDMEARMTLCNLSIEGGARAGMISPDATTFAYLAGRPYAPQDAAWEQAISDWASLATDAGATFDRRVRLDAGELEPMCTWGTNPGTAIPITGRIPEPDKVPEHQRAGTERALAYMGLSPGEPLSGQPVDVVFVGSCTNSRLSDLEAAASVLDGRRVAPGVRMLVVPGSQRVRREAEARGLAEVFRAAGAEWREAGCSMCLAMNDDRLAPGQYAVSTSNRNFEGRQGPGGRTFLASPLTAAASAVAGRLADVREML